MDASNVGLSEGVDARPAGRSPRPARRSDGPDRQPWGAAAIALLALVVALISAAAVYGWQHGKVANSGRELAAVRQELTTSSGRATALDAQIAGLRNELTSTKDRLAVTKDRLHSSNERSAFLGSRVDDVRKQLADVRADLQVALAQSAEAHQTLARMIGPPLADGDYRVRMLAAQVATAPPRVLVSQPFIGGAWRLIPVAPGTNVSIIRPLAGDRTAVSLGRFGKILRRPVLQRTSLKTFPYQIDVVDGRITKIVQKPPAA